MVNQGMANLMMFTIERLCQFPLLKAAPNHANVLPHPYEIYCRHVYIYTYDYSYNYLIFVFSLTLGFSLYFCAHCYCYIRL